MTNTHQRIKKRLTVPLELLLGLHILLLIMLAAQFIAGHGAHLVFLIWNIFLAWVPLGFALWAVRRRSKWAQGIGLAGWLAFLPNSFYIITDALHLIRFYERAHPYTSQYHSWLVSASNDTALVLDTAIIFTAALIGLIVAWYSMVVLLKRYSLSRWLHISTAAALAILVPIGVFIGRAGRWNSWDILTQPWNLAVGVMGDIVERCGTLALYIICFGGLVVMCYRVAYRYVTYKL